MPISDVPMKKSCEARTLDDEARGARKQASRQCAERSHQRILAGGELRRRERGHVGDEHDLRKGIGQALDAYGDGEGEEVALALRSDTSAWIGLG